MAPLIMRAILPAQFLWATVVLASGTFDAPIPVLWWNMSEAIAAESLTYDDQITAFALQGLVNRNRSHMLFFDIGDANYDWIAADAFWRRTLEQRGHVNFTGVPSSLCSLLGASRDAVNGLVVYNGDSMFHLYGDGYGAAIALTLTGQRSLLPVSARSLAKHECLKQISVEVDLRQILKGKSRYDVWDWAIKTLLPKASKKTLFNLNHYRVLTDPPGFLVDKQAKATASSIDYIVSQNAFVLDLESHSATGTGTAPWNHDDELIQRVFSQMDPLFDAYGWSDDEFSWTNETSNFGGTIMCSFASPNLSFWAFLRLMNGAATARKLPTNDRGIKLDRSKYYVTFETNEGDTPRILVSAMASAWASPDRGSVPIAWAIDPLLAERFPALFDYFAETASKNDSFIAGTAGAGYAFLNQMSGQQLQRYAERVGALTAKYGPNVFDTYGYANISVHEAYAKAAAAGGGAPAAFVTQPNWVNGPTGAQYDPFTCAQENMVLSDGTPLICASGSPRLFYYLGSLDAACPSCDLAERIEAVAKKYPPPFFVLAYGGLHAFGGSEKKTKKSFFSLQSDTLQKLGDAYVPIGASEMARLAREAQELPEVVV